MRPVWLSRTRKRTVHSPGETSNERLSWKPSSLICATASGGELPACAFVHVADFFSLSIGRDGDEYRRPPCPLASFKMPAFPGRLISRLTFFLPPDPSSMPVDRDLEADPCVFQG